MSESNEKEIKLTLDEVNELVSNFLKKYPFTISWRIRQHCKVLTKHLNPGEKIIYIFTAQNNSRTFNICESCVIAFTNKRIILARKNILWGYQLLTVTPDLFNDFEVYKGMIFGRLDIDTVKEVIKLSDIDPRALVEIETNLSEYLLKIKPKFMKKKEKEETN